MKSSQMSLQSQEAELDVRETNEELDDRIDSITRFASKAYYNKALRKLAKDCTENATIICDYILAEQTEINIKQTTKEGKNGYVGSKDGVLLVHPGIIVEVAELIRRALVKISDLSVGLEQREAKQAKLYDYIRGPEFANEIQKIYQIYNEMCRLQDKGGKGA